jgi:hypothetical protein
MAIQPERQLSASGFQLELAETETKAKEIDNASMEWGRWSPWYPAIYWNSDSRHVRYRISHITHGRTDRVDLGSGSFNSRADGNLRG